MSTYPHTIDALLLAPPSLIRLILHFNYCPAEYLHFSRRNQFGFGLLAEHLWQTRRALPRVSSYILEQLSLQDKTCLDPGYAGWPLTLLNPASLKRLQRYVAAVLYKEAIRICLLPEDVLRWRALLGSDAYKFALTGTKLLPSMQIPAYTTPGDAERVSNSWINAAMSSAPDAISERAKLKTPYLTLAEYVEPQQAYHLVSSLLLILEPKWCSFFPAKLSL